MKLKNNFWRFGQIFAKLKLWAVDNGKGSAILFDETQTFINKTFSQVWYRKETFEI